MDTNSKQTQNPRCVERLKTLAPFRQAVGQLVPTSRVTKHLNSTQRCVDFALQSNNTLFRKVTNVKQAKARCF
jgi:hypothetical protein